MNQAADFEEENGVSSPNSTVSSLSGKRSEREPIGDENEAERTSCSHGSDDEDGNGGDLSRKKLRLTKEQSLLLEDTFKEHNTLNPVSRYFFLWGYFDDFTRALWSFRLGFMFFTLLQWQLCSFDGKTRAVFVHPLYLFVFRGKSRRWQSS